MFLSSTNINRFDDICWYLPQRAVRTTAGWVLLGPQRVSVWCCWLAQLHIMQFVLLQRSTVLYLHNLITFDKWRVNMMESICLSVSWIIQKLWTDVYEWMWSTSMWLPVSKMTYTVSSGTLSSSIPIPSVTRSFSVLFPFTDWQCFSCSLNNMLWYLCCVIDWQTWFCVCALSSVLKCSFSRYLYCCTTIALCGLS